MTLQITLIILAAVTLLAIGVLIGLVRNMQKGQGMLLNIKSRSPSINQPTTNFQKHNFTVAPKYAASKLSEKTKAAYLKIITDHLVQSKAYQQPDLTIKKLAQQILLPTRHVSQVINEKTSGNFTEFINQYRIEAAKELLIAPDTAELPTITIGRKVGFKSKSTFYAVFKKYTQQSPAAFRKANYGVTSSARDYP